jgi:integrase/recombinase XerD
MTKASKAAIVDRMLYQLLGLTGLRITEALALEWHDVGPDYIMVRKETAKNGKARSVIIGKKLQKLLEEFKRVNPYPQSRHLFNTQKGPYKRTNAHERLKYWLSVAGIRESISCHSFRHTYATRLLDAGIPLTLVRDQLGHSSISVTSIYLHFTKASRAKLIEVF